MVISLDLKFEKLLGEKWVFLFLIIPLYLLYMTASSLDERFGLEWVLYMILLSVFMLLKSARNKFEITDSSTADFYWTAFGLKFQRTAILRSNVKGLFIIQLPSRYYALSLKLSNGQDVILVQTATKKQLKDKASAFWQKVNHTPFFQDMDIKKMPGREYIERKALIARQKAAITIMIMALVTIVRTQSLFHSDTCSSFA